MGRKKYKGPQIGPFFFNIYKPVGMTSFGVIGKLKKVLPLSIGKIGHFGTLDPFAEGVLLVGIGASTRFNIHTQNFPKEYVATGVFGKSSPTGDIDTEEGTIVLDESFNHKDLSDQLIEEKLNEFVGTYMQVPHSYSATKHQGKALHEWAREGVIIEKEPVQREIYEIELLERNEDEIKFRVLVSSGTYIRVLFEDLAKKLGTSGLLRELKRTKIGPHIVADSVKEDLWPKDKESSDDFIIQNAKSVYDLVDFESIDFDEILAIRYQNGQTIKVDRENGLYWVKHSDRLYGLGEVSDNRLRSCVNFSPAASLKIDPNYRK